MEYRNLGSSDLKVSFLGFGCWPMGKMGWSSSDDSLSEKSVHEALDHGINFFDNAPVYGRGHAENVLGKALKGRRSEAIIATKCGLPWDENGKPDFNLSPDNIRTEVEDSLKRLQTDTIDLYQLHWPDPKVSPEEYIPTIQELLKSGKIRYFGLSNFSLKDTITISKHVPITTCQGLYNLLEWDSEFFHMTPLDYRTKSEIIPWCEKNNASFLPYTPLMQGLLTGTFTQKQKESYKEGDVQFDHPRLNENFDTYYQLTLELGNLAKEFGYSLMDLAYTWLKAQKTMGSIITGFQRPEHIAVNIKSCEKAVNTDLLQRAEKIIVSTIKP